MPAADRGFVYSINTAFGFVGMTIGALAAALPPVWAGALGHAASFRPLFGIVLVGNAVNISLLAATPERHRPAGRRRAVAAGAEDGGRRRENRFLRRLAALNALNGLAVGLTGPLIAYWFALRFHVGAEVIGPFMAVTFAVTAVSAVVMARLTRRVGMVRTVVWGRSGGVVLLALLPLMPVYVLAALLYVARSALNRGSVGARQALVMSLVEDARRGFAASVNALSMQIPRSVGPAVAGALIGGGMFAAPFFMAAGLQALYVVFYGRLFAPLEREAGGSGPAA